MCSTSSQVSFFSSLKLNICFSSAFETNDSELIKLVGCIHDIGSILAELLHFLQ